MITLEKVMTELKPESLNEIIGGSDANQESGFFDQVAEVVKDAYDYVVDNAPSAQCWVGVAGYAIAGSAAGPVGAVGGALIGTAEYCM